jgi:hypothetical protein
MNFGVIKFNEEKSLKKENIEVWTYIMVHSMEQRAIIFWGWFIGGSLKILQLL